ncbi:MAG: YggS family pyridoxal phosphate-dependent enzyme [Bacteroidales bacterium]|nr:YggS family pyridoxal phosphate-dependent enzyme [Bacteroidales bacterium]
MSIQESISSIVKELPSGVKLVAVSKFHPLEAIEEALAAGQYAFGENRPQEFEKKAMALQGRGIEWHFIGHLQTNKLKMVLPYADLVQSVDSLHLLDAINDWGKRNGRCVSVLLELHVATEESKQGFYEEEILDIMFRASSFANVRFCGLMGMATNTDDELTVRADFERINAFYNYLRDLFPEYDDFRELSIGMSGDWRIAMEYGATIVRIGTAIFGEREY